MPTSQWRWSGSLQRCSRRIGHAGIRVLQTSAPICSRSNSSAVRAAFDRGRRVQPHLNAVVRIGLRLSARRHARPHQRHGPTSGRFLLAAWEGSPWLPLRGSICSLEAGRPSHRLQSRQRRRSRRRRRYRPASQSRPDRMLHLRRQWWLPLPSFLLHPNRRPQTLAVFHQGRRPLLHPRRPLRRQQEGRRRSR